jgi:Tol biopolymer transport system component
MAFDGSQRLQLTAPPLFGRNPRWSPDGAQIAFYGSRPGEPDRIYAVPAAGGGVRQLTNGEAGPSGDTDASWSADGKLIVFGAQSADERRERLPIQILDLNTRRISKLSGTAGLWSPRWSPDGRYIATLGFPIHTIWLYELATGTKKELTTIGAGFPMWSPDNRYIYFEDNAATYWYRDRVSDGQLEKLVRIDLKLASTSLGWVGASPDGSVLSTRNTGSTEIYAFDW